MRLAEMYMQQEKWENAKDILQTGYEQTGNEELQKKYPNVKVNLYAIRNDFFGEKITVYVICGTVLFVLGLIGLNLSNGTKKQTKEA